MTERSKVFHAALSMYGRMRLEGYGVRAALVYARASAPHHVAELNRQEAMAVAALEVLKHDTKALSAAMDAMELEFAVLRDIDSLPDVPA